MLQSYWPHVQCPALLCILDNDEGHVTCVLCYVATTRYVWWLRCLRDTWQRGTTLAAVYAHTRLWRLTLPWPDLVSNSEVRLKVSLSLWRCVQSRIYFVEILPRPATPRRLLLLHCCWLLADINLRPRADIMFLCGCLIRLLMYEWFLFNL